MVRFASFLDFPETGEYYMSLLLVVVVEVVRSGSGIGSTGLTLNLFLVRLSSQARACTMTSSLRQFCFPFTISQSLLHPTSAQLDSV